MQFGHIRAYPNYGIEYEFSYSLTKSDWTAPAICSGALAIRHEYDREQPFDLQFEGQGPLSISSWELSQNNQESEVLINLQFLMGSDNEIGKFLINIDKSIQHQPLHIKVPPLGELRLMRALVGQDVFEEGLKLFDEYCEGSTNKVWDFYENATLALNIDDFFELMDITAGHMGSLKHRIDDSIFNMFSNLISGDGAGRYMSVASLPELEHAFSVYNSMENLHEISLNSFIRQLLTDQVSSGINRTVVRWLSVEAQSNRFPFNDLSHKEVGILLSAVETVEGINSVVDLVASHGSVDSDWDSFTQQINEVKNQGSPREKAAQFRKLLYSATNFDEYDFRYIFSKFLYNLSEALRIARRDRDVRLLLLRICRDVSRGTSFQYISEMADYSYNMTMAYKLREKDHNRAIAHFQKSVQCAADESEQWDNSRYHHLIPALRAQTEAEVNELKDEFQYHEAMDVLEQRIELLRGLEKVDPDQQERSVAILEGYQNEIRASRQFDDRQYQRALESFNRAAGFYKRADRDGLFRGVVGRRYQIEALLAEVDGDFQKAATLHEKYAEELPRSRGARYHRGRKQLCEAKAALLQDDYVSAKEAIKQIQQKSEYLLPHEERFLFLIDATLDYRNENVSDTSRFMSGFFSIEQKSTERLITFNDDYVTGLLTTLSAQRLRQLPVSNGILDELVRLALEEACYPSNAAELSADDITFTRTLANIPVESVWQLSLPSHVLYHLEQVRTNRQTTFGDYSGLVRNLVIPLEQHLAVVVEYHAERYWGDDWEQNIPADEPFSIGDYFQFFSTEASDTLSCADVIREQVEIGAVEGKPVTQLRNALGHGKNPAISSDPEQIVSEKQFDILYDAVISLMRSLILDTPALGEVESVFGDDSYRIRIHWDNFVKRTWISYQNGLNVGELYYIPQDKTENDMAEVGSDQVFRCDEERARSFLIKGQVQ